MADFARLGVVIDPSGASAGARAVNSALDRMRAHARSTFNEFGRFNRQRIFAGLGESILDLGPRLRNTAREANVLRTALEHARVALIGYGAVQIVRHVIETGAAMERQEASLAALTGSTERARQEMEYLRATSERLGQPIQALSGSYSKLLALQESGLVTTDQARALLEGLGAAAAVAGLSADQLGNAFYGLSQALSQGTVRAEEFNQVTEPIPGLTAKMDQVVAASLGVTEKIAGITRRMVNDGKISSENFGKIVTASVAGYERQAAGMRGTFQGVANAFTNTLDVLEAEAGRPILDELIAQMEDLRKILKDPATIEAARRMADTIALGMKVAGEAVQFLTEHANLLVTALKVWIGLKVIGWIGGVVASLALMGVMITATMGTMGGLVALLIRFGFSATQAAESATMVRNVLSVMAAGNIGGFFGGAAMAAARFGGAMNLVSLAIGGAGGVAFWLARLAGPAGLVVAVGSALVWAIGKLDDYEDAVDEAREAMEKWEEAEAGVTKAADRLGASWQRAGEKAIKAAEDVLTAAQASLKAQRLLAGTSRTTLLGDPLRPVVELEAETVGVPEAEAAVEKALADLRKLQSERRRLSEDAGVAADLANKPPKIDFGEGKKDKAGSKRTIADVLREAAAERELQKAIFDTTLAKGENLAALEQEVARLTALLRLKADDIAATDAQKAKLGELVVESTRLAAAQEALRAAAEDRAQIRDETAVLQLEADLIGASVAEREREVALLERAQQLTRAQVDVAAIQRQLDEERGALNDRLTAARDKGVKDVIQSEKEILRDLQLQRQSLGMQEDAREQFLIVSRAIIEVEKQFGTLTEEQLANLRETVALRVAEEQAVKRIEAAQEKLKDIAEQTARTIADGFTDWIIRGGSFLDMIREIETSLLRLGMQTLVVDPFAAFVGGLAQGGGGAFGLGGGGGTISGGSGSGLASGGGIGADLLTFHEGGMVDRQFASRTHRQIAGRRLAPDEVPAILQVGERVQSRAEVSRLPSISTMPATTLPQLANPLHQLAGPAQGGPVHVHFEGSRDQRFGAGYSPDQIMALIRRSLASTEARHGLGR